MKIATKHQTLQIISFVLASLPSFLFSIQKETLSDPVYHIFHNKFNNSINCVRQPIFDKTAYVQSQAEEYLEKNGRILPYRKIAVNSEPTVPF